MNKKIIVEKKNKIRKDMSHIDKEICTKNQISIINQLYLDEIFKGKKDVIRALKKKLSSYKTQDKKYQRYSKAAFITYEQLIEKLVLSKLKCTYCYCILQIIYQEVREERQWTLDRLENSIEHTNENTVISCLKCNIQRGRICDKKFLFTKQMRIIKKY